MARRTGEQLIPSRGASFLIVMNKPCGLDEIIAQKRAKATSGDFYVRHGDEEKDYLQAARCRRAS
jgi:hypothetical protein